MNSKHRNVCINIYIYWKTLIHISHYPYRFHMLSIPSPVAQFQTLPMQNCPNSPEQSKICYVKLFQRSNTFQLEKINNPIIRPITSLHSLTSNNSLQSFCLLKITNNWQFHLYRHLASRAQIKFGALDNKSFWQTHENKRQMSCKAAAGSSSVVERIIYTKVQIYIAICRYIHRPITFFYRLQDILQESWDLRVLWHISRPWIKQKSQT